jgi:hypothetical protein
MFIADVRPYFRTRMETLGYEEWSDGFNNENIPETLLERVFHLESGEIAPTASNHQVHEVYLRGFNNPVEAIDNAYVVAETILADILLPANRFGTCIKDVEPGAISAKPLSDRNDNSVILEMSFVAKTFMKF